MGVHRKFARWGWVYVLQNGLEEVYKIGITRKSPRSRLTAFQTGNPRVLSIKYSALVLDAETVEADIHRELAPYKVHGEWFCIKGDLEATVLVAILRAESNYYSMMHELYNPDTPTGSYNDLSHNDVIRALSESVVLAGIDCGLLLWEDYLMYGKMALTEEFLVENPELMQEIRAKIKHVEELSISDRSSPVK